MSSPEMTPPEMTPSESPDTDRPRSPAARGSLQLGLAADGWLRWGAVDLSRVVEVSRRRHDLSPVAAAALGRSMAAAALLLRMAEKTPSRLLFEIRGDGPLGSVLVEVDDRGNLRGTVGEPRVDLPSREDGKLPVGEALGSGLLRVVRELPRGTYASQVELVSGEIGLDVAHFLEQSEQTRSAVLLGVLTRPHGVTSAGGMIVEVIPGAPEPVLEALEGRLGALRGPSWALDEGGAEGLLDAVFGAPGDSGALERQVADERRIHLTCRCSRERLALHLASLPEEDRQDVAVEGGTDGGRVIEAVCRFCATPHRFTLDELAALRVSAT